MRALLGEAQAPVGGDRAAKAPDPQGRRRIKKNKWAGAGGTASKAAQKNGARVELPGGARGARREPEPGQAGGARFKPAAGCPPIRGGTCKG